MTKYHISIANPTAGFNFQISISDQSDLDLAERNIVYVMQKVRAQILPPDQTDGERLEGVYVPPSDQPQPKQG